MAVQKIVVLDPVTGKIPVAELPTPFDPPDVRPFLIDSVFLTVSAQNPNIILGYGTWEEMNFPGPSTGIHAWKRVL